MPAATPSTPAGSAVGSAVARPRVNARLTVPRSDLPALQGPQCLCLIQFSPYSFTLSEFPLPVSSESPEGTGLWCKVLCPLPAPAQPGRGPCDYFIGSERGGLTLQPERLREGCDVPAGQDWKPGLLTPPHCSPCSLTEFTAELSSWVKLLVLCLEFLLYRLAYLAPMNPLGLS